MRLWAIVRRDRPTDIHGTMGACFLFHHRDHAERELTLTMRHPEDWIVVPVECEIRSMVGEAREALNSLSSDSHPEPDSEPHHQRPNGE